jgi:hypothetical protein
MKSNVKWERKAVKPANKGKFTNAAKKRGLSIGGMIQSVLKPGSKASNTVKKEAILARTFRQQARSRKTGK